MCSRAGHSPWIFRGFCMISVRFGALVVALLPLLAACGRRFDREAVITTDSAGVTIVDNDGEQPEWTMETTWRLAPRPRIQIGNQPYDPGQRLYRAEHVRLLA